MPGAAVTDEVTVRSYPTLLSPLQVGPVTLDTRIVLSAMTTGFGFDQGRPTAQVLDYFAARCQDVGMASVAFGAVRADGRVEERIPWMWRPDAAEALAPLAATIEAQGAVPCIQLGHGGRQVSPRVTGSPPVAPSAVPPAVHVTEPPRELCTHEIEAIVQDFGDAASAAAAAGFRAIEVHGGHGYLIQQFLSTDSNHRTDRWGGTTLEERARFAVAVVRAVLAAAPGLAVIVRLNGDDLVPGGLTRDDAQAAACAVVDAGAHAILVSGGVYGSVPYTIPLLDDPELTFLDACRHVRDAVDVPVITVGRVTTPAAAERLIRDGEADAVALGRALLADPAWATKARTGRAGEIRPCIATVQGCAGMLQHGDPISCAVNPDVGREGADPMPGGPSRRVHVIGGGVAGMEAARRAAELGHGVTLSEREAQLGGATRLAASTPPLRHLARLVSWYERRLEQLDVEVRLESPPATIEADLVVLATGASTDPPALDGYDLLPVWAIEELLAGGPSSHGGHVLPGRLVVQGNGHGALATALWCHERGSEITLLSDGRPGGDTSGLARRGLLTRIDRAGINRRQGRVTALASEGVHCRDVDEAWLEPAGALVLAGSLRPATTPFVGEGAIRVGDAKRPRGIPDAVFEARDAIDAFTRADRT